MLLIMVVVQKKDLDLVILARIRLANNGKEIAVELSIASLD